MSFRELVKLLKNEFKDAKIIEEDFTSLEIDCGGYSIKVSDLGKKFYFKVETPFDLDPFLAYIKDLPPDAQRAYEMIKTRIKYIRRFLFMERL